MRHRHAADRAAGPLGAIEAHAEPGRVPLPEALVPGESPGNAVEPGHEDARLAVALLGHHEAVAAGVGREPVREERRIGGERRNLLRVQRIGEVECHDQVRVRDRHHPVPSEHHRYRAAEALGMVHREDQLHPRRFGLEAGDAIEAAIVGVEEERAPVGEHPDLERIGVHRIARDTGHRNGPEQPEIRKPPDLHDVRGQLGLHRRAGGEGPVDRGQELHPVGPDPRSRKRRVRRRPGPEQTAVRVEFGEASGVAGSSRVAELHRREDPGIPEPREAVGAAETRNAVQPAGQPWRAG